MVHQRFEQGVPFDGNEGAVGSEAERHAGGVPTKIEEVGAFDFVLERVGQTLIACGGRIVVDCFAEEWQIVDGMPGHVLSISEERAGRDEQ